MGLTQIFSMIAALAVTLGLFGLAVWAYRRFAPAGFIPLQPPRARRLVIVESLMLDTQRRLVLVRLDDQERLILLGDGRLLASNPAPRAPQGEDRR
jgi:flagellar protein FliO/FliZ